MEFQLRDEFIRLGQVMKAMGYAENGADAKDKIVSGLVKVNGQTEVRRGRKLYDGDTFTYQSETVTIRK